MSKLAWTRPEITEVIPDGVEYVEPEVRELAAGIAADIRKYGHWHDVHDYSGGYCIVTAPSFKVAQRQDCAARAFPGRPERLAQLLCGAQALLHVTDWNDANPTNVVLARLDAIAEGLVER